MKNIIKELKVVIWGYPLNSHTHSYIHSSFYKAFKYLGHNVHWFHDDDYPEDFDYDNCELTPRFSVAEEHRRWREQVASAAVSSSVR